MARLGVRVEATEESTQQRDFSNIPNGIYRLEISASDATVKNEGTREQAITVKATFDVLEPDEFKGRKVFGNYNVEHPSAQAQEIGQKQFSCLLRALSMTESPEETEELHYIPFVARIGMGKDSKEKNADGTPKYAAKSEIKHYYYPDQGELPEPAIDENQPAPTPKAANDNRPAPQQQAADPKAGGRRPWGK